MRFEHGERMAFVIGIFQPRNHGLSGADSLGQLRLGEAGLLPQFINPLGNFAIGDCLLKSLLALRVIAGDIRLGGGVYNPAC